MSLIAVQDGFGTNSKENTLSDHDAAKISQRTYNKNQDFIIVEHEDRVTTYKVINTIKDESTGLHGYVLENEKTGEIVISFEGSRVDEGIGPLVVDWSENISSFVLGDSKYDEKENAPVNYNGTSAQDAALIAGEAIIKDGKFVKINKNQFTEADKVVESYIEEYGKDYITFVGHSLGGGLAEYFAVKYDSHAVTFAAPDIYNLLTEEQQKKADNGEYQTMIISYAYPDDIISEFNRNPIGSTYYLSNPQEVTFRWFDNHGIANFLEGHMFDSDGYYNPNILMDETLFGLTDHSPLALKNSGVSDFHILIKTAILMDFVVEVQSNATRIENTEKSFLNFWDFYADEMKALKVNYESKVGIGEYDMLHLTDVEEIFEEFGKTEDGVPLIFSMNQFEELLHDTKEFYLDTDEIAFYINKMSEDFEEMDELLAQWLDY